ncbi:hypothetical protein J6590_069346 [Homalodisca vitripennis]|nr:hypothetical protein J6590_069346 [Homalodisca vitripennis]
MLYDQGVFHSITMEEVQIKVLANYASNPQDSLRSTALDVVISNDTVHKLLKRGNFHLYKVQMKQELTKDDPDRRLDKIAQD